MVLVAAGFLVYFRWLGWLGGKRVNPENGKDDSTGHAGSENG